jgi:hypothetical protein
VRVPMEATREMCVVVTMKDGSVNAQGENEADCETMHIKV